MSAQARASLGDRVAWEGAFSRVQEILEQAERYQVAVLTTGDDSYPEWLRIIPRSPAWPALRRMYRDTGAVSLRRRGHAPDRLDPRGARVECCQRTRYWCRHSCAPGSFSLARPHNSCARDGLEAVYPKKNSRLAADILDAGGALLSEQPFGTPAIPRNLVQRDRLQSGMFAGTIVMQTDIMGGSMHTVRFTFLQGRLLFAPMPHGPHADEPKNRGIVALVRASGRELARMVNAEGDYQHLLERTFGSGPAATQIAGREDYDKLLLAMLDQVVRADAPASTRRDDPQLGLF
ncbi:MAG: DNA-processing protein DprA [Gammaproteobacteria bacterium]